MYLIDCFKDGYEFVELVTDADVSIHPPEDRSVQLVDLPTLRSRMSSGDTLVSPGGVLVLDTRHDSFPGVTGWIIGLARVAHRNGFGVLSLSSPSPFRRLPVVRFAAALAFRETGEGSRLEVVKSRHPSQIAPRLGELVRLESVPDRGSGVSWIVPAMMSYEALIKEWDQMVAACESESRKQREQLKSIPTGGGRDGRSPWTPPPTLFDESVMEAKPVDTAFSRYHFDISIQKARSVIPFPVHLQRAPEDRHVVNETARSGPELGSVCSKCGSEVRERPLLTSTYVGCLC